MFVRKTLSMKSIFEKQYLNLNLLLPHSQKTKLIAALFFRNSSKLVYKTLLTFTWMIIHGSIIFFHYYSPKTLKKLSINLFTFQLYFLVCSETICKNSKDSVSWSLSYPTNTTKTTRKFKPAPTRLPSTHLFLIYRTI